MTVTDAHMQRLEVAAKARQRTMVQAVDDANARPGMLAVATLDDAVAALSGSPYKWAAVDDTARATAVEKAATTRIVDGAARLVPAITAVPLGATVTVHELLPSWNEDDARTVLQLLRAMVEPLEDGSYLRRDRDVTFTSDGHLDIHEFARQALIERGLPSDESHIEALLVAAE